LIVHTNPKKNKFGVTNFILVFLSKIVTWKN
jgi:hypothetical protein